MPGRGWARASARELGHAKRRLTGMDAERRVRDAGLIDSMRAACAVCVLVAWRACRGGVALRG